MVILFGVMNAINSSFRNYDNPFTKTAMAKARDKLLHDHD
jgi:hypothetical protein